MQDERKLAIFNQVVKAIDQVADFCPSRRYVWTDEERKIRKGELLRAKMGSGLVQFHLSDLMPSEVVVSNIDDYSVLMACVVCYMKELGQPDYSEHFRDLYEEEMAHLEPALLDPGLRAYQMGVGFEITPENYLAVVGFVGIEGLLRLSTVKHMYNNIPNPSAPSDVEMVALLKELEI